MQQKEPHVGHRGSGLASCLRQWVGAGGGAVSPATGSPEVRFQAPLLAVRWEVRKCCLPLPALPIHPHPSVPGQVRAPAVLPCGGRGEGARDEWAAAGGCVRRGRCWWWDVDGLSPRSLLLKVGPTGSQHRDVETEAAGTREMGGAELDQAPSPPPTSMGPLQASMRTRVPGPAGSFPQCGLGQAPYL